MTTPKIAITQGLFDIIVEKASKMTSRCMLTYADGEASSICGYRDGKGRECFAGMILSNEMVADGRHISYMGGIINLIRHREAIEQPLPDYVTDNQNFIVDMQRIHDNEDNWSETGPKKSRMRQLFGIAAERYGLNTKTVDEHFPA